MTVCSGLEELIAPDFLAVLASYLLRAANEVYYGLSCLAVRFSIIYGLRRAMS